MTDKPDDSAAPQGSPDEPDGEQPTRPDSGDHAPGEQGDAPAPEAKPAGEQGETGEQPQPEQPAEQDEAAEGDEAGADEADHHDEEEGYDPHQDDYNYGEEEYQDYYDEEGYEDYYEEDQYDEGDYEDADEEEEPEDEEEDEEEGDPTKMTLVEHLEELRTRIIRAAIGLVVGLAISLIFGKTIFTIIQAPYRSATTQSSGAFFTPGVPDVFVTYLKICLYTGIIISSPWWFYQLWMFVSAGLLPNERRYVKIAVPFSTGLFVTGAAFFLIVIAKYILGFFLAFNQWLGVTANLFLKNYISFVVSMMLVFGLAFQTPIAVLLLAKMGLVNVKMLNRYRKHVIVGILIIAAFCTSPSPVDQIALAVPMWMLYELGVILAYFLVERKKRQEEAAESS